MKPVPVYRSENPRALKKRGEPPLPGLGYRESEASLSTARFAECFRPSGEIILWPPDVKS